MPLPRLPILCSPPRRAIAAIALLALGAGCAQVPELEATIPDHLDNAAYPNLIPLDGSLRAQTLPADAATEIEDSLTARRDRLQARSSRLSGPVVDPNAEARMKAGVAR